MNKYLKKFKRSFFTGKAKKREILYQIGKFNIILPPSHKLPEYQRAFRNYDKKLKYIIQAIESYYGSGTIIDIGANVGDTVAYIRSFSESTIYCIEGDLFYLKYLKKNIQQISDIKLIDSYISGRIIPADYQILRSNGTSRIEYSKNSNETALTKMVTLHDVLNKHSINLESIRLIKIDTDGFDFDIILANKQYITLHKPSIFFEYDISLNKNDYFDSIEVIEFLESNKYKFIVYDNFGNLLTVVRENYSEVFKRLNHYLKSCQENGGGINYFDVFASTENNVIGLISEKD